MSHAAIAANRFGLGARPGELKALAGDPRAWLAQQVQGSRPAPPEIKNLPSSADAFAAYDMGRDARRDARKKPPSEAEAAKRIAGNIRQKLAPHYLDQVAARYRVATKTDEPFRERLVHFRTNHFAVSADKPRVIALAGTLENEAIRPNLGRRFTDLLLAVGHEGLAGRPPGGAGAPSRGARIPR